MTSRSLSVAKGAVLALLLAAGPADAAKLFLNGVSIDGVVDQKFENCTVVIDAKGDVYITAKGYEVQQVAPAPKGPATPATTAPASAAPAGPVTRRYFLFSETAAPGLVQYDIDVFVNSTWVKRI